MAAWLATCSNRSEPAPPFRLIVMLNIATISAVAVSASLVTLSGATGLTAPLVTPSRDRSSCLDLVCWPSRSWFDEPQVNPSPTQNRTGEISLPPE